MAAHLNIPNLDKLIAHLEAQPPERISMAWYSDGELAAAKHACGTSGCIAGWSVFLKHGRFSGFDSHPLYWVLNTASDFLGSDRKTLDDLFHPTGYDDPDNYPAHRVIATLKRLRDHYLATGEIVVDWGPEPTAGEPWAAPQAVELTEPALPAEITRLLSLAPATETSGA